MSDVMRLFLSENSIRGHKEYLAQLKLKYSVLVKSEPRLSDLSLDKIHRLNLKSEIKNEAVTLLSEIKAHEIYFSSFAEGHGKYEKIKKKYLSADSLRYEIFSLAKRVHTGFLFVFLDRGGVRIEARDKPPYFSIRTPTLALDLCEHSYFYDYFFDKQTYLKAALSRLDLSKIKKS